VYCCDSKWNGLISRKQLIGLWSPFQCETEPLIQLMIQLDIMVRLEEGEQYLIPCMLPDVVSESVTLLCENPLWILRRTYLMSVGKPFQLE